MRFFCDVCVEPFTSQELLDVHAARHRAPQQLECATCLVVYGSPEEMAAHLCITYRDNYVCCAKDWRHHKYYNRHVFLAHDVKTNARVRMQAGQLLGKIRMARVRSGKLKLSKNVFFTLMMIDCCRKERKFAPFVSRLSRAARRSNIWRSVWDIKLPLCSSTG